MKILSKYRDYYDHIAHAYGGGDPAIIYKRDRINNAGQFDERDFEFFIKLSTPNEVGYSIAWLSVCSRLWLILKMNYNHKKYKHENYKDYKYHILCPKIHEDVYDKIVRPKKNFFGERVVTTADYFIGNPNSELDKLSRIVGQPVFAFFTNHYSTVRVFNNTPNLGDTGFAAYSNPEQTYQNIAYYITNVMRESPDTKPPVNVSDKDLIVAKGFDKKISFRHRKK